MNATSLLVSTTRLVFQYEAGETNLADLYRLVPYLRQSLSCTVCAHLLVEPFTPQETQCQHHVCRQCIGGRKNLKPSCTWCRNYDKYEVNTQLRILLQCYKSLCEYIMSKPMYSFVNNQSSGVSSGQSNGVSPVVNNSALSTSTSSTSLVQLIEEGASFQDNYKSNSGLLKSTYAILPCVYNTSSSSTSSNVSSQIQQNHNNSITTNVNNFDGRELQHSSQQQQHQQQQTTTTTVTSAPIKTVSNGSAMYSVMYAGSGNKITIKRKTDTSADDDSHGTHSSSTSIKDQISSGSVVQQQQPQQQQNFKKPTSSRAKALQKRKGCRCGNATPTPGKLTCCGQRCPCYVEAKSCLDCKCRGCRNPHRADGFKVNKMLLQSFFLCNQFLFFFIKIRPHIPELDSIELLDLTGESTLLTNKCLDLPISSFSATNTSMSSITSNTLNNLATSRFRHTELPTQDISIDQDSIVFNPNDIDDGTNIQGI